MERCPECAAAIEDDARWCGRCGHHLPAAPHDEPPSDPGGSPAVGRDTAAPVATDDVADGGNRWVPRRLLVVAAAVVALGLVTWSVLPGDAPVEDATPAAPEPVVAWEVVARSDPIGQEQTTVLPAGAAHVSIGRTTGTVHATRPGTTRRPGVLHLPAALRGAAVTTDGTWAVVEGGRIVHGDIASGETSSARLAPSDGWLPHGPAVAWHGELAVFAGTRGRLGAVARGGEVAWVTGSAVDPDGPVGRRWLVGTTVDGGAAAVLLDDGTVVPLRRGTPVAVLDDLLVVEVEGAVEGRALPGGERRWSRPAAGGASWTRTVDGLVEQVAGAVHLVDPASGERTASITSPADLVAVGGGAVLVDDGAVVRVPWAGARRTLAELPEGDSPRLVGVDDQRVGVVATGRGADEVSVLAAEDGTELAETRIEHSSRIDLVVVDGRVGVIGEPRPPLRGPRWLDPQTGEAVDGPSTAPTGDEEVSLGSVTLVRAAAPGADDPFGLGPPRLVATGTEDGTERWRAPALSAVGPRGRPSAIVGRDASEFGPVVVEAGTAVLQGRFLDDGLVAWNVQVGGPITVEPVLTGARVVVAVGDGSVAARDPARGLEVWRTDLGAAVTAVAPAAGRVVVATDDARVVVLDSLGRPVSEVEVGGVVRRLAVVDGSVVAATGARVLGLDLAP